jgi:uncharacterized protein (DUF1810 family)
MHEALCRSSGTTLDNVHAKDGPPITQRTSGLGPRLDLCTGIVLTSASSSLHAIFGSPDDMKFRSCMTLFSRATADPDNSFRHALDRWCGGRPDERTLALLDSD